LLLDVFQFSDLAQCCLPEQRVLSPDQCEAPCQLCECDSSPDSQRCPTAASGPPSLPSIVLACQSNLAPRVTNRKQTYDSRSTLESHQKLQRAAPCFFRSSAPLRDQLKIFHTRVPASSNQLLPSLPIYRNCLFLLLEGVSLPRRRGDASHMKQRHHQVQHPGSQNGRSALYDSFGGRPRDTIFQCPFSSCAFTSPRDPYPDHPENLVERSKGRG